jgi:uncharacterized membrane protein/uncharacterized cupin superfamily protein
MSVLSIWVLDVDDVDPTIDTVTELGERELIEVFDAAAVRWPTDATQPSTTQITHLVTASALDASFWGQLFGLTFFPAELGPSAGATASQLQSKIEALGIGADVIDAMRAKIRPGKGAVLTYTSGRFAATGENRDEIDKVRKGINAELIRTNVSADQAAMMIDTFSSPKDAPLAEASAGAVSAIDLATTYLHIEGSSAAPVDGGAQFWDALLAGRGTARHESIRSGGWLVTSTPYLFTWPTWEMHPNGDEIVSCVAGLVDLRLELPDGETVVQLAPGRTVVVPAGIWHTATVLDAGSCIHITAGKGTEVRPA